MTVILIALATCVATLLGGAFALRLKDQLHLILGFSAGAVVGVAFFDLMPEAIELGSKTYPISTIVPILALGFFAYLILDRLVLFHAHAEGPDAGHARSGAATLSLHSFLDGVGIGLAFHVSGALGVVVAAAVIAHDFSDGINTVNFVLKNRAGVTSAWRWLIVDSIAPIVGVAATYFFVISEAALGLLLALFAGFFLYIGASDLVPESYHEHPVRWTTVMTLLGAGAIYLIISLAS